MSRLPASLAVLACATFVGPALRAAPTAQRRDAVVSAVERVSPAVVGVRTQVIVSNRRYRDPFNFFFRDFHGRRQERVETLSQGSGVIIDVAGYVLTNYHVIAAGGDIELELQNKHTVSAEVVGTAPDHDLAVLRITDAKNLRFVPMGKSDDLMIGETVIAIGNPFGLSHSVTTGVISALHRSITTDDRTYADFIQTDAAINPGNSGGPLLTVDGTLVGVNTAVYGKAQGIGFAIPIDKAKRIVSDLLRYGEVRRAYFGFEVQDLSAALASSYGLADDQISALLGAVVSEVDPKGPAARILHEGDVVSAVGGVRVTSGDDLRLRLGDYTVGSSVTLRVVRDKTPRSVELRPGEMSPEEALKRLSVRIGLEVFALGTADAQRARLPAGTIAVQSVSRGSAAAHVGLRPGHLIRAVNSQRIIGLTNLGKALARNYWRGHVALLIQTGRTWQEIVFEF